MYGLKQAPRAWFDRLRGTLLHWGFQNARSDVSLFYLRTRNLTVFILIYVDDILVTGNDSHYIQHFIQREVEVYLLILNNNKFNNLSLCRVIKVDLSMLLRILNATCTYVLIMLQYRWNVFQ